MTRAEYIKFCKKCTNRKMDVQQGLVCSITGKKADFEDNCVNFHRDESVKDEVQIENKSTAKIISELPEEVKGKLRPHQDLVYAIVGGFFLSVICALIWATITIATNYQISYMAIGVGFVVGMGIRFFGAGIDPIFGYVGGFFSLLGCLMGNLFSQVGFIAQAESLGYFETLTFLDFETIILIYQESFSIIDLIFYGFALYEGYRFAFRPIPTDIGELNDLTPAFSKLRLPLVIVCFIILSISGFTLTKGVTGEQVFYFEDGSIQAQGEFVNGKENGLWHYFYENGKKQVVANYLDGIENGYWEWYFESGELMRKGRYRNGLFDGTWLNFNEDGVLIDSSNYAIGRLDGDFKSFYDNGKIFQTGKYERDKQIGEWKTYYDNGNMNNSGFLKNGELTGLWKFMNEDGTPFQEINYLDGEIASILNVWDMNGKQLVKDGEGTFVSYFDSESKLQEGKVAMGIKVGIWKIYHSNGKIKEVGEFKGNEYIINSAWTSEGEVLVQNGNGEYVAYFEDSNKISENGYFKDGLHDGIWLLNYPNSTEIQQELNYKDGKLDGRNVTYYTNGNIISEGILEKDKKIGEWKWYYESGQLQCTVNYIDDKKQGDQIFWSESGSEVKKEVYNNGEFISETLL